LLTLINQKIANSMQLFDSFISATYLHYTFLFFALWFSFAIFRSIVLLDIFVQHIWFERKTKILFIFLYMLSQMLFCLYVWCIVWVIVQVCLSKVESDLLTKTLKVTDAISTKWRHTHTHTHTYTYKKGLEDNVPSLKGFNIVLGLTVYQ
jgi:hypothetical protein